MLTSKKIDLNLFVFTLQFWFSRYSKDERYKGIEKSRERESIFNEFMLDVKRKDKEERAQKREAARKDFLVMLKEDSEIDRHTRWGKIFSYISVCSVFKTFSFR